MIEKLNGFKPYVKLQVPTVYDDTLTYYETVTQVIGYLNDVIDKSNDLIDETNEFHVESREKAIQLRKEFEEFGDDVLNNLVPVEIVDTLNKWQQDGKLANLINDQVFGMKANQVDLDDTNRQLAQKAKESELQAERARIDNLIALDGDTEGNSELLDIRVASDGFTYPSAGEAVRQLGREVDSIVIKSSNLFNKHDTLEGTNFDNSTGEFIDGNFHTSGFIKATPNTDYSSKNILKVGRWDKDKNYLSHATPRPEGDTFTSGPLTEWFRVVTRGRDLDVAQLNKGSSLMPFDEFGSTLNPDIKVTNVYDPENDSGYDVWEEDRFVIDGVLRGYYKLETTIPSADINSMTADDIYQMYDDELVQPFPNFFTKHLLGVDGDNKNIHYYHWKTPEVPTETISNDKVDTKKPKLIIASGFHGEEGAGVYNLFQAIKHICENWKNNELLETLLWNAEYIIVPVVNNYGFNNNIRQNENGIDLSRQFPVGFNTSTVPGDQTYGGEAPLSEPAAQLMAQLMEEHKDAIYFSSFHNFGNNSNNYFIWNASATKLQVQLGKQLVSKMTRKWSTQYGWMDDVPTDYIGWSDHNAPGGSEAVYAASLGIQGSTFEVSNKLYYDEDLKYASNALTLGTEVFINWLLIVLRENTKFYNGLNNGK